MSVKIFRTHAVWINKSQTGYCTLSAHFRQELKEDRQEIISFCKMCNCFKQLGSRTVQSVS